MEGRKQIFNHDDIYQGDWVWKEKETGSTVENGENSDHMTAVRFSLITHTH